LCCGAGKDGARGGGAGGGDN